MRQKKKKKKKKKKVCLQTEILGNLFKYILFCFLLLFTSSSSCREDQFAALYFSTSLIVLIQVYSWEIRHHSLVCCCGFADILNIVRHKPGKEFALLHFKKKPASDEQF